MKEFKLIPLREENVKRFKHDMQEAFQSSAEDVMGPVEGEILPEKDIDRNLSEEGVIAYEAIVEGELVGGAIVTIDKETQHNELDFLYVKRGVQSHGIGQAIWKAIESLYPETKVWETITPYFDKRNIHFYINKCGFHAVEFFCQSHHDEDSTWEAEHPRMDDKFEGAFRFEKNIEL